MEIHSDGRVTFISDSQGLVVSSDEDVQTILLDIGQAEFEGIVRAYRAGDLDALEIRDLFALTGPDADSGGADEKIEGNS